MNSLLSKAVQKRMAEGKSAADALQAVKAQPVQPTAEEIAAMDARLAAMDADASSPSVSELSRLSDEALERWLR